MVPARFIGLAIALGTLLLFWPAGSHDFINYDDPDYITANPVVQQGLTLAGVKWAFASWHASNWHPLTWVSHMMDCQLFGLDPGAHHFVNVLLHTLNAWLAFVLFYRLTGRLWPSGIVAALFAWHPLHVQSVAWAAERKDVLSTLLWLLLLLAYAQYARRSGGETRGGKAAANSGRAWYAAALALFAVGLMAKPMVVTAPFTLLILDYWPLGRGRFPRSRYEASGPGHLSWIALVCEKWPFFVLSALASGMTFLAQRTEAVLSLERIPLIDRVGNALLSYGQYLFKTVLPLNLAVLYPLPSVIPWTWVAVSAVVLASISAVAWFTRNSRPHLLSGWLWYCGTLVPVIGLVQVGTAAMADRYTYVPLLGIFWAAAFEVATRFPKPGRSRQLAGAIALALLAGSWVLTARELRFWKNSQTLFERAIAVTRNNAVAHSNLGVAYEQEGRATEAERELREALRIDPNLAQAHNNLANLLDASGKGEEALTHYREAVRLKPRAWESHANVATCLARLGRTEEAKEYYVQAVKLCPGNPRPPFAMGMALLQAGQGAAAADRLREAIRAEPNHFRALTQLARVLASDPDATIRNSAQAVQYAERAVQLLGGNDPYVLDTLAMAYAEAGRYTEAVRAQRRAVNTAESGGDAETAKELRERLKLYESGIPFRVKATATREQEK